MEDNKIKCLVVDDEPLAKEVLIKYIGQLETLSLAGSCDNAIDTLLFLQQHKVDLLFLDIQMPRLSGIDLLRTLTYRPKVIFTTAFREYALEGFELNVLDYLLKPISFERFLMAINKYHATSAILPVVPYPVATEVTTGISAAPFMYIKVDKKMVKIFLRDILYIEGLKDYIKVKTIDRSLVTYQRLTYLEEKLPDTHFLRIHRSYIIALDKISSFSNTLIEIGQEELPIGRQYKPEVMKALGVTE
ncbi:LytTR family DNA-binding domain-containing protein [Chitinophaga pendula]|uniref:LytR/AlgR family response regulator transcription factor n=1 Tax=Chitinophaga TaxID=79328 RepID=UPI000BAFAD16|nr:MULTISPECIES: LytTR family DNA-binding domain-containing protein [Chitinophaga]ASZ12733.1 DNA-binding response regulator [Chitinophaga sp. MD30]UCJ09649.1 LytTR family DNA-binding domain-containing protein [Chitinophaga pendula]